MTSPSPARGPRVFEPGDPKIVQPAPEAAAEEFEAAGAAVAGDSGGHPRRAGLAIGWGSVLIGALVGLSGLALSVSFASFVAAALERQDWVGWTASALLVVAAVAACVLALRELVGLVRLARLARLRKEAEQALVQVDGARERDVVQRIWALYRGRRDLAWALSRLGQHAGDVRDPGELLKLTERDLLAPLDSAARRTILKSARRVSVVTAVSPLLWIAMLFVALENLRMLRSLASLYGGRPGGLGALRLARMVVTHIVATGGLALTDDLLGQFLGQDVLRRLSRRLGEGAFNGAMTARIGTAAIDVTRPMPFLEAQRIRVRDLVPEIFRRQGAGGKNSGA